MLAALLSIHLMGPWGKPLLQRGGTDGKAACGGVKSHAALRKGVREMYEIFYYSETGLAASPDMANVNGLQKRG